MGKAIKKKNATIEGDILALVPKSNPKEHYPPEVREVVLTLSALGYTDRQVEKMTGVSFMTAFRWRKATPPEVMKQKAIEMRAHIEGVGRDIVIGIMDGYADLVPKILDAANRCLDDGDMKEAKAAIVSLALIYDKGILSSGLARRTGTNPSPETSLQQTNIQVILPSNGRDNAKTIVETTSFTVDKSPYADEVGDED